MFYRCNKRIIACIALLTGLAVAAFTGHHTNVAGMHIINVKNPKDLKEFFHYSENRVAFISSHRGGPRKGFPENCIATFENTLQHTWSIIEMDPHFTKDSALVVMHDPTLDRTSNGHGKIADYTLAEIRKFKLKDTEGNMTDYGISTLDEMLEWVKGKTILVVDMKEVPIEWRVKKIIEHHAQANAIVIAYSYEDAQKCYSMDKDIMMEVMMPDKKAFDNFATTGVPWSNIVAFVTHTQPADNSIYQQIHSKGTMCIRGSSRTVDRDFTTGRITNMDTLVTRYYGMINGGADIIEADLGIEAGEAVQKLHKPGSPGLKYFMIGK